LAESRDEDGNDTVKLTGKTKGLEGIRLSEMSADQKDLVRKVVADLLKRRSITATFSPGVRVLLAKQGFSEEFGARELRRLIKRRIEDPLTELILDHDLGQGSTVTVRVRNGEYAFTCRESKVVAQPV
jgi:ATP-dependent Clp protease ATP-binding subunit ClpA